METKIVRGRRKKELKGPASSVLVTLVKMAVIDSAIALLNPDASTVDIVAKWPALIARSYSQTHRALVLENSSAG